MSGKELYEVHSANVLRIAPYHSKYVYAWDDLTENAKAAWEATARFVTGAEIPAMEPGEEE